MSYIEFVIKMTKSFVTSWVYIKIISCIHYWAVICMLCTVTMLSFTVKCYGIERVSMSAEVHFSLPWTPLIISGCLFSMEIISFLDSKTLAGITISIGFRILINKLNGGLSCVLHCDKTWREFDSTSSGNVEVTRRITIKHAFPMFYTLIKT